MIEIKLKGNRSKSRIRQRREEAIERQKGYDGRTPEQQLKLIKTRPGESKKENHRLKLHNKLRVVDDAGVDIETGKYVGDYGISEDAYKS